jgi:VanZ family protein
MRAKLASQPVWKTRFLFLWHRAQVWLPICGLMMVIFILSAQPKYSPSSATTGIYFSGFIPVFPGFWETFIKKGAHVVMYAFLSILSYRSLLREGMPLEQAPYAAIVIATIFAFTDEWHQIFTFGRSASGIDIGIDFVGATLAALVMRRVLTRQQVLAK